jgi:hypothetical protein
MVSVSDTHEDQMEKRRLVRWDRVVLVFAFLILAAALSYLAWFIIGMSQLGCRMGGAASWYC